MDLALQTRTNNVSSDAMATIDCYYTFEDVEPAFKTNNEALKASLTKIERQYSDVNVAKCTADLSFVAHLLATAFAGSKGYDSNTAVISLTCDYQTLVTDMRLTSSALLRACLGALENYSLAFELLANGDDDDARELLGSTGDLASEMAAKASALVKASEEMTTRAKTAMEKVSNDHTQVNKQRSKAVQTREEHEAEKAALVAKNSKREPMLQTIKNDEANAVAVLDKVREAHLKASGRFGASVFTKESDVARQVYDDAREREAKLFAERIALQKEEIKDNAALAVAVANLNVAIEEGDDLDKAYLSLDVAITALGRVTKIFQHVREYWTNVNQGCSKLTQGKFVGKTDSKLFRSRVQAKWCEWLVLAKINNTAKTEMGKVADKIGGVMSNLPTTDKAKLLLPGLVDEMKAHIAREDSRLTNTTQQLVYESATAP